MILSIIYIQFIIIFISWIMLAPFDKTINFIEKRIGKYNKVLYNILIPQLMLFVITILILVL